MPIEMKQIKKSYGDQKVLTNFSIFIEDGEKICLMGESGIGKTTILRILAGLTKPDSGQISGLQGKKVSMVFQENRLLGWANAFENVALVLNQKKFGAEKKAGKTAIANFLLQEFQRHFPGRALLRHREGCFTNMCLESTGCTKD